MDLDDFVPDYEDEMIEEGELDSSDGNSTEYEDDDDDSEVRIKKVKPKTQEEIEMEEEEIRNNPAFMRILQKMVKETVQAVSTVSQKETHKSVAEIEGETSNQKVVKKGKSRSDIR